MIIHQESNFIIGYGDIYCSFDQQNVLAYQKLTSSEILHQEPFSVWKELLGISYLAKIKQVHGCQGIILTQKNEISNPFLVSADYLITNLPDVGLAIATADCLPVMLYDAENHVIASAHAGWKGVVANILSKVLEDMHKVFGTKPENVRVFIGPSGGSCCYEVKDDVLNQFKRFPFFQSIVYQQEDKKFLDLTQAVLFQLAQLGVLQEECDITYNKCTICSSNYASHRRGGDSRRNLTVITLKKEG